MVEGDYSQFALVVFRRHTGSQTVLRISLLGEPPGRGGPEAPTPAPPARESRAVLTVPQAGTGTCPPARWINLSAWPNVRASQRTTSSSRISPVMGFPGRGSPVVGAGWPVLRPHPEPAWCRPGPGPPPPCPALGASLGLALGSPGLWTSPRAPGPPLARDEHDLLPAGEQTLHSRPGCRGLGRLRARQGPAPPGLVPQPPAPSPSSSSPNSLSDWSPGPHACPG